MQLEDQIFTIVILNYLIFFIMLLPLVKVANGSLLYEKYNKRTIATFYALLYIVNATFACFSTDFWHYFPLFEKMNYTSHAVHIEFVYFWIYRLVGKNYFLWRFIVWSLSIIVTIHVFNRYHLNLRVAFLLFTLLYSSMSITMRGSLAVALMFWGCSYLFNDYKPGAKDFVIGLVLICVSYFFHSSMLLSILMIAVMIIRLRPVGVIFSVLLFPILYQLIPDITDYMVRNSHLISNDDMGLVTKMNIYATSKRVVVNFNGIVHECLQYSAPVLALLYMTYKIVFSKEKYPPYIKSIFSYWYWMFYCGFLFFHQELTGFISLRLLLLGYLPMVIVLSYQYTRTKKPSGAMNGIFLLSLMWFFYKLLITFKNLI